jgi:D-alanyl-D-alanine carboxypeptidase/D-alanyl-D-alanine-endopeptidase (penicillin-binding protein 4)
MRNVTLAACLALVGAAFSLYGTAASGGTGGICIAPPGAALATAIAPAGVAGDLGVQDGAEAAKSPGIPERLEQILDSPTLRGSRVGIVVRDAASGALLAERDGNGLYAPASVTKIFTAATALSQLGPAFVWQTPITYRGEIVEDTIEGDVWVLGRGAPDTVEEQLWLAARAIQRRGIARIAGDIIVDDRFFDAQRHAEGWPGGIQTREAYHAPISALMANYSAYREGNDWRAVPDAALYFGERLSELLGFAGVAVGGEARYPTVEEEATIPPPLDAMPDDARAGLPDGLTLLYTIRSEPLARLVMDLNKFSNNVMAETILKTLGAVEYGVPGTTTKGLAAVARFLDEELDTPLNSYIMADGSGLSDLNRFSPQQVVDLLIRTYSDFHVGPEFVSSLKLGGLDGWNPRPFRDPPLVGEMRLKSGHIKGVNTLSGYAHTGSGRVVAFCVLINDHRSQQWEIDQRMAEISQVLLESY